MQSSSTPYRYLAFGLKIESELSLPELQLSTWGEQQADVEVILLQPLKDTSALKPYDFIVTENSVEVWLPDAGYFQILAGQKICITPEAAADEALIRLYVLGTCLGVCLLYRKLFPLHGSAIAIDGEVYAVVGDSGAGKSTIAKVFLNQGYEILSDDVIAICMRQGRPMVIPSYPHQKLWQNSLDQLGVSEHAYMPIYGRETKYSVPIHSQFCEKPLPLGGIIELSKGDLPQGFTVKALSKLEQLHKLYEHTYRQFLVPPMALREWHFLTSTAILEYVSFFQVCRSPHEFTATEIFHCILDWISEEVVV